MAAKKKTSAKKASKKAPEKSPKTTVKKKSAKKTSPKKKTATKIAGQKKLSPQTSRLVSLTEVLTKEEVDFLISQAETMVRNHKILEKRKKVTAAMNPVRDRESIEIIEGEDGSHFIIVLGVERNFFARDEMKKIVKLCHAADNQKDGMRRLYTWLDRFRSDILRNNDIGGPGDPGLGTIYRKIVETYTVGD